MTRNLKALGPALLAVFAMSAVAATAASAQDKFTTSTGNPAFLTGTQEGDENTNFFSTKWAPEAKVGCEHGSYKSTGSVASGAGVAVVHRRSRDANSPVRTRPSTPPVATSS